MCTIAVMMMSVVRILGFKLSAFLSVYSALLALYYIAMLLRFSSSFLRVLMLCILEELKKLLGLKM